MIINNDNYDNDNKLIMTIMIIINNDIGENNDW